jgi:hypothetical protein
MDSNRQDDNRRLHSVRKAGIWIIIPDKKDYFSKNKRHGFSRSGERAIRVRKGGCGISP